ncbi:hypothetical protein PM082_022698 [Marasmius tenuissimus]|nr:hypothetical protein PM082_022698 [Marasmius tenuissimus]
MILKSMVSLAGSEEIMEWRIWVLHNIWRNALALREALTSVEGGTLWAPTYDDVDGHLEHIKDEIEDIDTFRVDWEELSNPTLLQHFNQHNPDSYEDISRWESHRPPHLSLVEIPDFDCPFDSEQQLEIFEEGLSQIQELYSHNMHSRASIWDQALALAQLMVRQSI